MKLFPKPLGHTKLSSVFQTQVFKINFSKFTFCDSNIWTDFYMGLVLKTKLAETANVTGEKGNHNAF